MCEQDGWLGDKRSHNGERSGLAAGAAGGEIAAWATTCGKRIHRSRQPLFTVPLYMLAALDTGQALN